MYKINRDILQKISEYVPLNKLFETSKMYNAQAKNIRKIYLIGNHVIEYINNRNFFNSIHKLISFPNKQICIIFRNSSRITNVGSLGNVHTLSLRRCTGITDVNSLGNVHALHLSGCIGITDVSSL